MALLSSAPICCNVRSVIGLEKCLFVKKVLSIDVSLSLTHIQNECENQFISLIYATLYVSEREQKRHLTSRLIELFSSYYFFQLITVYCPFPGYLENGKVLLVGNMGLYDYRPYVKKVNCFDIFFLISKPINICFISIGSE